MQDKEKAEEALKQYNKKKTKATDSGERLSPDRAADDEEELEPSEPPPLDEVMIQKFNHNSNKPITHLINKDFLANKDSGSQILPLRENLEITYGVTYMEEKDFGNK